MPETVEWATGPEGASWYAINLGIARLIAEKTRSIDIRVVAGGGKGNPTRVNDGESQFGTTIDFLSAAAYHGMPPYEKPHLKLRTIGIGWSPPPFHLVASNKVTLGLSEALLSGQLRIGVPPRSTSDELTFQRILLFYGTSYDQLTVSGSHIRFGDYNELVSDFANNRTDYVFGATAAPATAVTAMGDSLARGRLLPFPTELMDHLSATYGYGCGKIGAGTYPRMQQGDIATTVMETIFLVSSDLLESVVYEATKTLVENRRALSEIHNSMAGYDPRIAWQDVPVPLHPGAARAYHELGFMR